MRAATLIGVSLVVLVAEANAAATPADYARLATPVLDAVDTLEQVFTRPVRAAPPP